jgi:hypothetical protein
VTHGLRAAHHEVTLVVDDMARLGRVVERDRLDMVPIAAYEGLEFFGVRAGAGRPCALDEHGRPARPEQPQQATEGRAGVVNRR